MSTLHDTPGTISHDPMLPHDGTNHQGSGSPIHSVMDSPIGPLTLVVQDGALTRLAMQAQRHRPAPEMFGPQAHDDHPLLDDAIGQLTEYFEGRRTRFDLPLRLQGTPFQSRVWAALREIPYGTTISYGQLAARIGSPRASRAVGLANGRNPIAVIVPCHRIVAADGTLGGYGGGAERKRHLLALEGRVTADGGP